MTLLLVCALVLQTCGAACSESCSPCVQSCGPVLAITGSGIAVTSVKATEYKIVLYADVFDEDESAARVQAEALRKEVIKAAKSLGAKEEDVALTNLNSMEPVEDDPYFRIEQDIQVSLKNVKDINKAKEMFILIDGVQIGSATPLVSSTSDYAPAVAKARKDAVAAAKDEARALADEIGVTLGEPVYVTENVTYPVYEGYETGEEPNITVLVTIHYEMINKK